LVLAWLGFGFNRHASPAEPQQTAAVFERRIIPSRDIFYNEKIFAAALSSSENIRAATSRVLAVVVPHHLLAAEIIAGMLARSRDQAVETVVIIGPNHDDNNASTVGTAHLEWQTPVGAVATADVLVDKFLSDFRLQPVPGAFLNEHSVGAVVPFVRHYFPLAKVMPIIFNSTASLSDSQAVARWLKDNLSAQSLVVVSTDFSHYLTQAEAGRNDDITERLILEQKTETIIGLSNGFVDSPPSLATVLFFAQAMGAAPEILYRANANDFSERPFRETTSYFGILFN